MKRKAQDASKWLKRSLELEAEVGDDTEAYQMTPEELAEWMEEELAYSDADALDEITTTLLDEDEDNEGDEPPPMVWSDEEGRFV
jgi:hypothetical protein